MKPEDFNLPATLYGIPIVVDPNLVSPGTETTPTFGTLAPLFERLTETVGEFRGSSDPTGKDCRFTCECGHEHPAFKWTGQSQRLLCPACGVTFTLLLEKP